MTSRVSVVVYISCQECGMRFQAEIPVTVLPVTVGCRMQFAMPEQVPVPKGWYQRYGVALCPDHNPHPPRPEAKEAPSQEIVDKAQKLQALAMDKAASEGERRNAWEAFEKLWKKYDLPPELGLEGFDG